MDRKDVLIEDTVKLLESWIEKLEQIERKTKLSASECIR